MTMNAEKMNPRKNRKITTFGDPVIIIGGIKKNVRKMIEENARDTKIYEQIDKYGLNPIQETPISDLVEDWTKITGDLRNSLEIGMVAKEKFAILPREIRNQFNNDINLFMKEGPQFFKEQHEKIIAEKQKIAELNKKVNNNVTE